MRRKERIGSDAVCAFCGYKNPVAMMSRPRPLLEAHHVFGRHLDSQFTVGLCRNCHAEITEDLRRAGVPMKRETNRIKRVALMLIALSTFMKKAGEAMSHIAKLLLGENHE